MSSAQSIDDILNESYEQVREQIESVEYRSNLSESVRNVQVPAIMDNLSIDDTLNAAYDQIEGQLLPMNSVTPDDISSESNDDILNVAYEQVAMHINQQNIVEDIPRDDTLNEEHDQVAVHIETTNEQPIQVVNNRAISNINRSVAVHNPNINRSRNPDRYDLSVISRRWYLDVIRCRLDREPRMSIACSNFFIPFSQWPTLILGILCANGPFRYRDRVTLASFFHGNGIHPSQSEFVVKIFKFFNKGLS